MKSSRSRWRRTAGPAGRWRYGIREAESRRRRAARRSALSAAQLARTGRAIPVVVVTGRSKDHRAAIGGDDLGAVDDPGGDQARDLDAVGAVIGRLGALQGTAIRTTAPMTPLGPPSVNQGLVDVDTPVPSAVPRMSTLTKSPPSVSVPPVARRLADPANSISALIVPKPRSSLPVSAPMLPTPVIVPP